MPSLPDRLRGFLARFRAPVATPTQDEPQRSYPDASRLDILRSEWGRFFMLDLPRRQKYIEYDKMDSGPVAVSLDDIVDACFISDDGAIQGFKVETTNPKYQQVCDQITYDTGLMSYAREALRDSLKYGDQFTGIITDEFGNITALEAPLPFDIVARVNTHGLLQTGTDDKGARLPYQQIDAAFTPVASWFHWEMLHLKYWPSRRRPYSTTSYLEQIRADWQKLTMIEQGMVVGRMLRAYPRNKHMVDVTGKNTQDAWAFMNEYVNKVKQTKGVADGEGSRSINDLSIGAAEDLFVPTGWMQLGQEYKENRTDVQMLDPDLQGLRYLPDVEYLRGKQWARLPMEMMGVKSDTNDVNQQDIAFARFLQYCQRHIIEAQLLRPLFTMGLFLKFGGVAQDLNESLIIRWPSVIMESSWRISDAKFRMSMAEGNTIEQGTDNRMHIAMQKHGWTNAEWEAHVAQVKKEQDTFGMVPDNTQAAQVRQGNNSEQMMAELLKQNPDFTAYLLWAMEREARSTDGNGHHKEHEDA